MPADHLKLGSWRRHASLARVGALVLLLLMAQAVGATHDVVHAADQHRTDCAICLTAAAAGAAISAEAPAITFLPCSYTPARAPVLHQPTFTNAHRARAPPASL